MAKKQKSKRKAIVIDKPFGLRGVDKLIINDPATIIKWDDPAWRKSGTTVVKCRDTDEFNPLVGALMCFAKYASGDKRYRIFKKKLFAAVDQMGPQTPDEELAYLAERVRRLSERCGRSISIAGTRYEHYDEPRYGCSVSVFYRESKVEPCKCLTDYSDRLDGIIARAEALDSKTEPEK